MAELGMTEFGKLAEESYHGDTYAAARDLLLTESRLTIKKYLSGMTEDEVRSFVKAYRDILQDRYPGGSKMVTDEDFFCRVLHVRQEQLRDLPNPYTSGLKKAGGVGLLIVGLTVLISLIFHWLGLDPTVVPILGALFAFVVLSSSISSIIDGIQFHNMQTIYHSQIWQEKWKSYQQDKERIDLIRDLLFVNNVELDARDGLSPANDPESKKAQGSAQNAGETAKADEWTQAAEKAAKAEQAAEDTLFREAEKEYLQE